MGANNFSPCLLTTFPLPVSDSAGSGLGESSAIPRSELAVLSLSLSDQRLKSPLGLTVNAQ